MTQVISPTDRYTGLFRAFAASRHDPEWLAALRREAFSDFLDLGFPTQDGEEWRYTNPAPIVETEFDLAATASVGDDALSGVLVPGLDGPRVVFVNGVYSRKLSRVDALPKGVIAGSMTDALATHGDFLREHVGTLSDHESAAFTALNTALWQDGFVLVVPANVVVEQTIQIVYLTVPSATPAIANVRNLFSFATGSQASLVEINAATSEGNYLNNIVTEVFVAPNVNVDHYRVQRESERAFHVSTLRLHLDRDSNYRSHTIDFGGALVRNNSYAKLDGSGSELVMNGLYVLRGTQHVDNAMWVEHAKERIPSHELYKGILDGKATAVFTGRIYVHREAQKTDAKQTNQNLLLSDDARVVTKPQLEIYADDVKCTHGATIGQMDATALFYLMSRGVDRETARELLIHAFASDIVERIRIEPLREAVEEILSARLRPA